MGGEQLVRDTLAAYAERAPRGGRLAAAARERAGARRRVRLAVAGAAVATAAVAVGAVALVPDVRPGTAPLRPVIGTATPAPPVVTLDGPVRFESWRGMQVAVPAGLPANELRCGEPRADTIVVPRGQVVELCRARQPAGLTVAYLDSAARFDEAARGFTRVAFAAATLDGRPAQRVTARGADGRAVAGIVVRAAGLAYWVVSPDRERAETLVAQAHLVDVDHAGCPTRAPGPSPDVPPARPDARAALVPGEPVEASACRYDADQLLVRSARVAAGPLLDELRLSLNALPAGGPEPSPSGGCAGSAPDRVVLAFRYAAGPPVDVHVREGCAGLDASNGAVRARVTRVLLRFLAGDLVGTPPHWPEWYDRP